MVLHYQFGHAPALPTPGSIDAEILSEDEAFDGEAVRRAVKLRFGPRKSVSLSLGMHIPTTGNGPYPVIVHNSPGTFEVHMNKIVCTGHSRGGQTAALMGMMDERVAVVAPARAGLSRPDVTA